MKKLLSVVILSIFFAPLFAGVRFGALNLNDDNEVLFTVTHSIPGTKVYSSLFSGKLNEGKALSFPEILTCFPEEMEMREEGKKLQIRNCYGSAIYSFEDKSLTWLKTPSKFPINSSALVPISISPNGMYYCCIERTKAASGRLVIYNTTTNKKAVLDSKAVFSFSKVPIKWSNDGTKLIYEKNASLYFCIPEALFSDVQIEEKYRKIGNGNINCIEWAGTDYLVYVDSDIIYRIDTKELVSLGMYAGLIRLGTMVGRLPKKFNYHTDCFKTNSTASAIVIVDGNNSIMYCEKNKSSEPSDYFMVLYSAPYTGYASTVYNINILWPDNAKPIIWSDLISTINGKRTVEVYTFDELNFIKKILSVASSDGVMAVSPNGKYVAFSSGEKVFIYSTTLWKREAEFQGEKCVSLEWIDSNKIVIGGTETVRLCNIITFDSEVLFLSSAKEAYWSSEDNTIYAKTKKDGVNYKYDREKRNWAPTRNAVLLKDLKVQNERYRVFTGTTKNALYENALYVRTLSGSAKTLAFLSECVEKTQPRKKVALILDAVDNVNGLSRILSALKTYDVKPTFFLNGEFIRRYPVETRQIVASGYECASMFFTPIDLTQKAFVFNEDYIRRGLARNEDEFFRCTSAELSLYWHAPSYKVTEEAQQASLKSGYTYVNTVEGLTDSTTLEMLLSGDKTYLSASSLIDKYIECLKGTYVDPKTGKSVECKIIPVTVGIQNGHRIDFLYEKIDVLINAIYEQGYEIVPVSEL